MAQRKPRILSSRMIYKGHIFSVRRDRVIEPSGHKVERDVVVHHGSAVLLPVFSDGRILLIRQYRHPTGQSIWELVAGRIEPGESPAVAARQELIEETGYRARHLRKLMDIFPTPGYVNEHLSVFACTGLTPGKTRPDPDEFVEPRRFSLRQLERMIRSGRLRDAKSIAAILYYARYVIR